MYWIPEKKNLFKGKSYFTHSDPLQVTQVWNMLQSLGFSVWIYCNCKFQFIFHKSLGGGWRLPSDLAKCIQKNLQHLQCLSPPAPFFQSTTWILLDDKNWTYKCRSAKRGDAFVCQGCLEPSNCVIIYIMCLTHMCNSLLWKHPP